MHAMRTARFRLFVRRKLDRELSRQVIGDDDIFAACCEAVCEKYDCDCEHCAGAQGQLTDFLQWLIDNADAIIAVIKKIIDLFK